MKKAILIIVLIIIVAVFGLPLLSKANYYLGGFLRQKLNLPGDTSQSQTTPDVQSTNAEATNSNSNPNGITAKEDSSLKASNGLTVFDFATNITNARDLQISPGGTLLVSQTSQGKIVALPDVDQNGSADETKVVLNNLDKPHGLAFYQGKLYVAEESKVVRYNWDEQNLTATKDKDLFTLPTKLLARHFTRGLEFDSAGNLFVSIGSTCDVCLENNEQFASVIVTNGNGDHPTIYARGLRNAVFLKVNPKSDQIWVTEMGRDALGDGVPPDEIDILKENANYGWPYCYGNRVADTTFTEGSAFDCAVTELPIYEVPPHSSPLGLTFINSHLFPDDWQGDLIVAYHGANQGSRAGFKVVHQKVSGSLVTGEDDLVTGFLTGELTSAVSDRPVDVEFAQNGNLYVSDDKGGKIYLLARK